MTGDFAVMDERFMRRALSLARRGIGLSSPNPTVGCVVVRDGEIVGEGFHDHAKLHHAEVNALRAAGARARGATAYVTLEPCVHHGRTPPCTDLLIRSGIRRLVVAAVDPNPQVSGKGILRLRNAGIEVDVGLLSANSKELIEPFACYITRGLPLVVSKVGMSLDGRIAVSREIHSWISSEIARAFGQTLRLALDALLVGVGTVLSDDPELTYRGLQPKNRPLLRVILDTQLRTPIAARVFRSDPPAPVLIFCSPEASAERRKRLEKQGAEVVSVAREKTGLDLGRVLKILGQRSILGVLVEGGSTIHWSFLAKKLVDKFYFIVAPLVLGGTQSVPAVGGKGISRIEDAVRFKLRKTFRLGSDLALECYPDHSSSILSPWQS